MSSRTPRRTFAHPFVVTLAAVPAACSGGSASGPPPHRNPPPPGYEEPAAPAPTDPAAPDPAAPAGPAVPTSPPGPVEAGPAPPAPVEPAQSKPPDHEQRWHVFKSGDKCMAAVKVECPKGAPGQPVPTCNPPPPTAYACPPGMIEASLTVVRYAHSTTCVVERAPVPVKCPKGAMCNPPPPRRVDCPK